MGTVQGCQPCHSVSSNSGLVVRLPRQLSSLYDGPAGSRGVYHAVAVRFLPRQRARRRVASRLPVDATKSMLRKAMPWGAIKPLRPSPPFAVTGRTRGALTAPKALHRGGEADGSATPTTTGEE